jgi:putative heme degradation protein
MQRYLKWRISKPENDTFCTSLVLFSTSNMLLIEYYYFFAKGKLNLITKEYKYNSAQWLKKFSLSLRQV